MPGPTPKPPSRRIRTTTKGIGVVRSAGAAPRMPSGLCSSAQTAWTAYWSDVTSGVMRPADVTVALRWIRNLDRYHRLIAKADRNPTVIGSTGQPRPNPSYDLCFKLEASIDNAERRMGISPLDRLRLGAQLAETAETLAQINAEEISEGDDPRAALTIVAD
jgi:hypothetical protein